MKILYDYQGLTQQVGGVSRCFCEYIKELSKGNEINIACPHTRNVYMQEILGRQQSALMRFPYGKELTRKIAVPLNMTCAYFAVKKNDFDIFHPTMDWVYYYRNVIRKPFVLTIHDLIPEIYFSKVPEKHARLTKWLKIRKSCLQDAARVMCVSEHTKKDLLNYYDFLSPEKIDVVYHGIHPFDGQYANNIWGRFILYVGQRGAYKNFESSMEALKPLLDEQHDLRVICTGNPFSEKEIEFIAQLGLNGKIVCAGFVDEATLASLYHHAQVFIYPSKYEGFGIPILEAFVNGCPACISNATCFPEVGGDAVSYFDANDKDSILQSVRNVVSDNTFAEELRKKGQERASLFTWSSAAEKVLACYKKALQ